MRILFVSTNYIEPGKSSQGLPVYLHRICGTLNLLGNKVIIIYSSNYTQHREENGIDIYAVRIPFLPYGLVSDEKRFRINGLLRGYYLNNKVEEIEKTEKIDIIQYASIDGIGVFYRGTLPAAIRLSSYAKIAYSSDYDTLSQYDINDLTNRELEAANHISNAFGPSEYTAKEFGRDCNIDVTVIESPFLCEDDLDYSFANRNLLNTKYVLFFGRMYAEKGIIEIADVLESFLKRNKDYCFVFIGKDAVIKGESSYSLIRRAAGDCFDRVYIYPEQVHKLLFPVVENAEFVVSPSHMENFSNACMEAMYYNGIVVAYENSGFEQLIIDGNTGFLCKRCDSEHLLEVMNYVVDLEEKRKKEIRIASKNRIKKNSAEIIAMQLMEYYKHIIDEGTYMTRLPKLAYFSEVESAISLYHDYFESNIEMDADKKYLNNRLLEMWLQKLVNGTDPIDDYFNKKNYSRISVYGVAEIGKMVIDSLERIGMKISALIDSNPTIRYKDYHLYTMPIDNSTFPETDVIIVTPIYSYCEIKECLKKMVNSSVEIISVESIIFDV